MDATSLRTHSARQLAIDGASLVGSEVTVCGWMEVMRGGGKVGFIQLRDGTGHLQAVARRDDLGDEVLDELSALTRESTLRVTGEVALKRAPKVREGESAPPPEYEVVASEVEILTQAAVPLPVGIVDRVHVELDTRLDHRHLDLRRAHVNAMFELRSLVLRYGREFLAEASFLEIQTPKIIAAAAEGGTNLFEMAYFNRPAYLSQSPQLYKQLAVLGGLDRVYEIGPAFRAEHHDTYRHLNEFVSFDIEMGWANAEDCMIILERMIAHIWSALSRDSQAERAIQAINAWRSEQDEDAAPVILEELETPFPRVSYDDAIEIIQNAGGEIEWGEDISAEMADKIAAHHQGFHFITGWPMEMKPFYIHHDTSQDADEGKMVISSGFDLMFGRDEMTSGGQREHRIEVLEDNLRAMGLEPADFGFYLDGFRYGAPQHAGWGLGVARLLMVLTGASNVREVVLFPRDRRRVTP